MESQHPLYTQASVGAIFTRLQVLKGSLGKVVLMHARVPPERSQGEKPQLPNQRGSSVINTTMNDRPDDDDCEVCFAF